MPAESSHDALVDMSRVPRVRRGQPFQKGPAEESSHDALMDMSRVPRSGGDNPSKRSPRSPPTTPSWT